jgi:hypothetical protein
VTDYELLRERRGEQTLPDFWPFATMEEWQAHSDLLVRGYAILVIASALKKRALDSRALSRR